MNKALIITDNPIITSASAIEAKLSTAGWTNEKVSTNPMMGGG